MYNWCTKWLHSDEVPEQCHVNNASFASRKECIKKKMLKLSDMIIDIKKEEKLVFEETNITFYLFCQKYNVSHLPSDQT